jgi:fructose-1-phosphate kinase PfkB-like protein
MFVRFVTLTLHPAIDRILHTDTLEPGGTFNAQLNFSVPSGKGVNTARSLRSVVGKNSVISAVAWVGSAESEWFTRELLRLSHVRATLCERACATRLANTLLERSGRETHIKETMPAPSPREESALLRCWSRAIQAGDIVAVCGSAPPGTRTQTLKKIFGIARQRRAAAIIADTNGAALDIAGQSGIDGIKGNTAEIGAWLNLAAPLNPKNARHRRVVTQAFQRTGAPKSILVTMGAAGAIYLNSQQMCFAAPPPVSKSFIVTATGCGDAATAGWMWSLHDQVDETILLQRVIACGTAKLACADPGKLKLKDVTRFVSRVKVFPLSH